jgi:hypothetical protein
VLNDLSSGVAKLINCFVGSYCNRRRAIQPLPPTVEYKVSTVQKSKLNEIPARLSAKDNSEAGMQAVNNEIRLAGIQSG